MVRVVFGLAVMAAFYGMLLLFTSAGRSYDASENIASIAVAIGWAAIPYFIVRLLQIDFDRSKDAEHRKAVLEQLRAIAEKK